MKAEKKYRGVVVPMITPLNENLTIDRDATSRIVNHILEANGFPFILGTTGESPSIPRKEKHNLVKFTVEAGSGKSLIYTGISGNSIYDAIEESHRYQELGVDVFVSHMASYYPVDEDQILRYFEELADQVPCPLIIYNIPATTNLSIPLTVVDQLSHHPNIVGFKDSERSTERIEISTKLWKDRGDFSYFSGWAAASYTAMQFGADGIVPSSGNLIPQLYSIINNSIGNPEEGIVAQNKADTISERYQKGKNLGRALSTFKAIMSAYGLCKGFMMPPLYPLGSQEIEEISKETIAEFGDLKLINQLN